MSFKVGDEVYVKATIIKTETTAAFPRIEFEDGDTIELEPFCIIPASRVTVAKARRAARMPEDYGKTAWFFDDEDRHESYRHYVSVFAGYAGNADKPYIENDGKQWDNAEVEE